MVDCKLNWPPRAPKLRGYFKPEEEGQDELERYAKGLLAQIERMPADTALQRSMEKLASQYRVPLEGIGSYRELCWKILRAAGMPRSTAMTVRVGEDNR